MVTSDGLLNQLVKLTLGPHCHPSVKSAMNVGIRSDYFVTLEDDRAEDYDTLRRKIISGEMSYLLCEQLSVPTTTGASW